MYGRCRNRPGREGRGEEGDEILWAASNPTIHARPVAVVVGGGEAVVGDGGGRVQAGAVHGDMHPPDKDRGRMPERDGGVVQEPHQPLRHRHGGEPGGAAAAALVQDRPQAVAFLEQEGVQDARRRRQTAGRVLGPAVGQVLRRVGADGRLLRGAGVRGGGGTLIGGLEEGGVQADQGAAIPGGRDDGVEEGECVREEVFLDEGQVRREEEGA